MNEYSILIEKNIRKYREMNNLTQIELATYLQINQSTLSLIESGKRECNYELICKICNTLVIEPNELFSLI